MRSELNETRLIDRYLFGQLDAADRQSFEAGLLFNTALAEKVDRQRLAHRLIRLYARNAQRRRLEVMHRQLLTEPAFTHQLKTIFT